MPNAARMFEQTEHKGSVMGGSPNVTINGLPAARFKDYHTCPSDTDGYLHIGGPISEGSASVTINGLMAARKGDGLVCLGPEAPESRGDGDSNSVDGNNSGDPDGGLSDDDSESQDEVAVKRDRDKKWGEMDDKKWGSNKLDERRGPTKYQKKPLFNIQANKDWGHDSGEWKEGRFWGDHGKVGVWEYHAKSSADVEVRSIKDFRGSLDVIDFGGSFSGVEAKTNKHDIGIGTGEAEVDLLHVAADVKAGLEIDTKKNQYWAGASGEIGGSVVEGKISAETKQINIPFTNWGITIEAEGSGSFLTAKAEGHAGARWSPKKGFSARFGGKLGAFVVGLGFNFGFSIGPMEPPTIPQDKIATGSPNVIIGG